MYRKLLHLLTINGYTNQRLNHPVATGGRSWGSTFPKMFVSP